MILRTKRLLLRPWAEGDAEDLFEYAKDPAVGPIAGWPPHKSVQESLDVIRNVLNGPECFAVCLKEDGKAAGAVELKPYGRSDLAKGGDECELGYWLARPLWGQGLMTEAANEVIRHGFEDLGMKKIWCAYYDGNVRSARVQEKCGFRYQWKSEDVEVRAMNEKRTGHVNLLTREEWLADRCSALTEELLEGAYAVVDIFPERIPEERGEAYFAAERFYLEPERLKALHGRFADLLLKLACYHEAALFSDGKWAEKPGPDALYEAAAGLSRTAFINVLFPKRKTLITLNGDDLYLTVYGADEAFTDLVRALAGAEGLFFRTDTAG